MDPKIVKEMRSHFSEALCPRRVVVCILYDSDYNIKAWGVNGPVSNDCFIFPCEKNTKRGKRHCQALHAEDWAIRKLGNDSPHYAYISRSPCLECCKKLIHVGVREIHVCSYDFNRNRDIFLKESGIKFVVE